MEVEGTKSQIAYQNRRVKEAEEEAEKKISAARDRVKHVVSESETEVNQIRDDYTRRSDAERLRTEGALANLQDRTYSSIVDQKRKADAEQNRVKKELEKELLNQKTAFDIQKNTLDVAHKKDLNSTQLKNANEKNFQEKLGKETIADLTNRQNQELEIRSVNHSETMSGLTNKSKSQQESLKQNTQKALEEATEHYQSGYERVLNEQNQSLSRLGRETKNQLDETRLKTEHRLAQYQTRQNDPFYKLVDLKMKLSENEETFRLTAIIPEHEQKKIQVTVRGNELILSGKRSNQERLELGEGKSRSTSSYQTFHESVPLTYPVNERGLQKRFEGDVLIVDIPKRKNSYEPSQTPPKGRVSREETVMAIRPQFPSNIPGEKALADLLDSAHAQKADEKA
jgi:HSP20 family molecular chaperone IbpA